MTVDTVAKIEGGEKCGLNMSSYEDLPPPSTVGGGDCNGDGKDDYVFINGSDAASDDHGERGDGGNNGVVLNVSDSKFRSLDNSNVEGSAVGKVNGGDQLEIHNGSNGNLDVVSESKIDSHAVNGGGQFENHSGESDKLDNEIKKIGGGLKVVENGVDVERESEVEVKENGDDKVSGELATQNGEIKSEDGMVVEDEVDVKVEDLEVAEGVDIKLVLNEVKDRELSVENGSGITEGTDFPSLDDDDDKVHISQVVDSGCDTQNGAAAIVGAEPQAPDGDSEEQQQQHVEPEIHEGQTKEPETVEVEIEVPMPEVVEDTVVVREAEEAVDCEVKESKPFEADVVSQSLEDRVTETHSSDEVKVNVLQLPECSETQLVDGEGRELPVDDAITGEPSSDREQQDLLHADVENEELGPVDGDAKVKEQGDLNSLEVGGYQELSFVDSHAAGCELHQSEEGETVDQNHADVNVESDECKELQTVPMQATLAESQSDIDELAVSANAGHADQCQMDSTAKFEESYGTSVVDVQSDIRDQPGVDFEPGSVEEEGNSKLIAEVGGDKESSVGEHVLLGKMAEETDSVDVIDKEVSSEDLGVERATTVEEATSLLKIQAANEEAVDEDGNDLGANQVGGGVSVCKVIDDDLHEHSCNAESFSRYEDGTASIPVKSVADLPVTSDSATTKGVVEDASSVTDNDHSCSAEDIQANVDSSSGVHDAKLETKAANGEVNVANKLNCFFSDTLQPKISFGSFDCVASFSHKDVNSQPEVLSRSTEFTISQSNDAGDSESKAKPSDAVALRNSEANGFHVTGLDRDRICAEIPSAEEINREEVAASHLNGSGTATSDAQNAGTEVVRKPFYYLIRIPRYESKELREQMRQTAEQVEEKTRSRDAIRFEYQKKRAVCQELKSCRDAARSEERAARELMVAKRREIDAAQSLINRAREAMTIEDVDSRILSMEHKIQHETLALNEEKQLIREIKQLKNLREQYSANSRRQQELRQALDQKVHVEEQLKVLRKEMDALRNKHSKADESVKAAEKKYDDETALLNELYHQHKSADAIRQQTYLHLQSLKKQLSEKNKYFWKYKDDARAAYDYAATGDKNGLERHCVNQVEKVMELWNNNDEFRAEYVRLNRGSTLRRFKTEDGRWLNPDEEPPSLGNISDDRVNALPKVSSVATVSTVGRDLPIEAKNVEAESSKKVVEQKTKAAPAKKMREAVSKNSSAEASGRTEIEEEKEERRPTKEEEELARKKEQLRKEEEAARLREQRRLEEKAKAQEALERKRRMAEKAQAKAEFRARKEAEEKEKEREKRAKKKEKKKGRVSEISETEPTPVPEPSSEIIREAEVTEKASTVGKKPQKPSLYTKQIKTTKPIPPPLRNRGRRRMQQWIWAIVTVVAVLALFFLGNSNFFRNNWLLNFDPAN